MTEYFQIAPGYNNTGGLEALHELEPPLFWQYELGVKTEWHHSEALRVDGFFRRRTRGKPFVVLMLQAVSEAEAALLESMVGAVTINVRNKSGNDWTVYNGELWSTPWGDYEQQGGYFKEVEVEIHALREL